MTIDLERMRASIEPDRSRTHWEGCIYDPQHRDCAILALSEELAHVRAERNLYREILACIAAYDDGLINERLHITGSCCGFDEPCSVAAARAALNQMEMIQKQPPPEE